jgi:hypothetical protein
MVVPFVRAIVCDCNCVISNATQRTQRGLGFGLPETGNGPEGNVDANRTVSCVPAAQQRARDKTATIKGLLQPGVVPRGATEVSAVSRLEVMEGGGVLYLFVVITVADLV